MKYTKRLTRLEQALQPPSEVRYHVILIGEDEPEPPDTPGIEVIHVTLGATPPENAWYSTL